MSPLGRPDGEAHSVVYLAPQCIFSLVSQTKSRGTTQQQVSMTRIQWQWAGHRSDRGRNSRQINLEFVELAQKSARISRNNLARNRTDAIRKNLTINIPIAQIILSRTLAPDKIHVRIVYRAPCTNIQQILVNPDILKSVHERLSAQISSGMD